MYNQLTIMKAPHFSLLTTRCSPFSVRRSLFTVNCLLIAILAACGLPREVSPADARATLDAAVQQTVSAQQTAGATPSPLPLPTDTPSPAPTEAPPIGVTLQWPTDTPAPTTPSENPTATPTPVIATATPAELVRPNGSPAHAARLPVAPTVDGDLTEWGALLNHVDQIVYKPANWSGANDNSAAFALGWDANNLYLAISVVDDHHQQTQPNEFIYKGDSVEILLDADLAGDYTDVKLGDDDYQLGFSPGNLATGSPAPQAWLWFPKSKSGVPAGVSVAVKRIGEGFSLEAAIPWSVFGVTPSVGGRYGLVVSVSDNDNGNVAEQESLISTVSTRQLVNPTTWGTLVLDD